MRRRFIARSNRRRTAMLESTELHLARRLATATPRGRGTARYTPVKRVLKLPATRLMTPQVKRQLARDEPCRAPVFVISCAPVGVAVVNTLSGTVILARYIDRSQKSPEEDMSSQEWVETLGGLNSEVQHLIA